MRVSLGALALMFLDADDWRRLFVLLHRQRYVDINHLVALGRPDTPEHFEELAEITGDQWARLFASLSAAGLMWQARNTYFELHPLFARVLADAVGKTEDPARVGRIERSFAFLMHSIGMSIAIEHEEGDNYDHNLQWAHSEEHNLRHATSLALRREWWELTNGPLSGLRIGYQATGRRLEWAELVKQTSLHVVSADGNPLPGREGLWAQVAGWMRENATTNGEFGEARVWGERLVEYRRSQDSSDNLAAALLNLAITVRELDDPICLAQLEEAKGLVDETEESARPLLAAIHYHLGMSYQQLSADVDLMRAFEEYGASLE